MNNGDMPAMPMGRSADGRQFTQNDLAEGNYAEQCKPAFGLTKREYFAAKAMQGLLANPNIVQAGGTHDTSERVQIMAASYADNVLRALDNPPI